VNKREATRDFKMTVDEGHAAQQNYDVKMLENGEGVALDMRKSARYYKMADNQGDDDDAKK
jgi:TPR repeat protein